jgi:hypothetical protein
MRSTYGICILCVKNGRLSTEDKVVALGPKSYRHATTKENECEHVAILMEYEN